ncbi:MAG: hypothetical protein AB1695_01615 [Stygiobacter sp.]|jgi:hypothetical protein
MNINSITFEKNNYKDALFDLLSLTFIFFVPTFSHLTSLPLYYFEPMRILLLASLVHTTKRNVYLLTFLLPIFSFIISSHPSFYKAWLISTELTINVFLFLFLIRIFKNGFLPMIISVIGSKIFYYITKYFLIQLGLINGELISTPIIYQFLVTLIVTIYVGFFYKKSLQS